MSTLSIIESAPETGRALASMASEANETFSGKKALIVLARLVRPRPS